MSLILSGSDGVSDIDGTASTPAIRGTDANTGIFFPAADTIAFAEGGTESMRLDSSGNTLYAGRLCSTNVLNTVGGLQLYRDHATGNCFLFDTTPAPFHGPLIFGTSNAERMRITTGGELLVGTTSAGFGTLGAMSSLAGRFAVRNGVNTSPLIAWNAAGTSGFFELVRFANNAGTAWVGGIDRVNDNSVQYNTSSDYRLKENIAPMVGALAKVQQLKPVTYTWKSDGSSGQGFIAHELQEIVPECVTGEKDAVETYTDEEGNEQTRIKPQGIDTSFLVATLTAAIQELNQKVEAQAAKIAELEAK